MRWRSASRRPGRETRRGRNRVISALIRDGSTRKALVLAEATLYAPRFLLEELDAHKGMLLRRRAPPTTVAGLPVTAPFQTVLDLRAHPEGGAHAAFLQEKLLPRLREARP